MKRTATFLVLVLIGTALCVPAYAGEPVPDTDSTNLATEAADQAAPAAKPAASPTATGPIQIKVNNDVWIRFGALLQPQADFQELSTGGWQKNLFIRRTRFIATGQVAKNVAFWFQTENSKLAFSPGNTKPIATGFQIADAVAEWRPRKEFGLWAGLIYLPTTREALKSSGSEFAIDTSAYAYTATTALAGSIGRDTGMMARGYLVNDHFEYRAGLFQGLRAAGARNTFRKIARVQYNFFDTEVYAFPAYQANVFGAKKILALGAAYDAQQDYKGRTADLFWDIPAGFGSTIGTLTYQHLDGGVTVPTMGASNIYGLEAGFIVKTAKVGPYFRYEERHFENPNSAKDEKRTLVGLNFYPRGNNFNVKLAYQLLSPKVGKKTTDYVIQLQLFVY